MKTLIILMFIMLVVLLALNVTLYINFNQRLNSLKNVCTNAFNQLGKDITNINSRTNAINEKNFKRCNY